MYRSYNSGKYITRPRGRVRRALIVLGLGGAGGAAPLGTARGRAFLARQTGERGMARVTRRARAIRWLLKRTGPFRRAVARRTVPAGRFFTGLRGAGAIGRGLRALA